MKKSEVLAKCLEARDRGEDPGFILENYPELRQEIEPLLSLVDEIGRTRASLDVVTPRLRLPRLQPVLGGRPQTQETVSAWAVCALVSGFLSLVAAAAADDLLMPLVLLSMVMYMAWWSQRQAGHEQMPGIKRRQERG